MADCYPQRGGGEQIIMLKTMFGTLISLENTDFRNLIFAIFTRNSSLFLRKMTCQNPKFSIFANKFSVPNMV